MSLWVSFTFSRFLSTLSLRRATAATPPPVLLPRISIHALLAESDVDGLAVTQKLIISIHALLAESDLLSFGKFPGRCVFLSTLSLRRATGFSLWQKKRLQFLSTLSLRRATVLSKTSFVRPGISIHALLAESDGVIIHEWEGIEYFYPRSPCGERPASTCATAR